MTVKNCAWIWFENWFIWTLVCTVVEFSLSHATAQLVDSPRPRYLSQTSIQPTPKIKAACYDGGTGDRPSYSSNLREAEGMNTTYILSQSHPNSLRSRGRKLHHARFTPTVGTRSMEWASGQDKLPVRSTPSVNRMLRKIELLFVNLVSTTRSDFMGIFWTGVKRELRSNLNIICSTWAGSENVWTKSNIFNSEVDVTEHNPFVAWIMIIMFNYMVQCAHEYITRMSTGLRLT